MMTNNFIRLLFACAMMLVCVVTSAQSDVRLDSLDREFRKPHADSVRLRLASQLAYDHYNVDSVIVYSDSMIALGRRTNDLHAVVSAWSFKAWAFYNKGEHAKACEASYEGIAIADSIGSIHDAAKCYHHLGNAFSMLRDASTANTYFHKAVSLFEQAGELSNMTGALRSMAHADFENNLYDQGQPLLERAMKIDDEQNFVFGKAANYWLAGYGLMLRLDDTTWVDPVLLGKAKYYAVKAVEFANLAADPNAEVSSKDLIADVLVAELKNGGLSPKQVKEKADSCMMFIRDCKEISVRCGMIDEGLSADFTHVRLLLHTGHKQKAQSKLDSLASVVLADDTPLDLQVFKESFYKLNSELDELVGRHKSALDNYKKFHYMYVHNNKNDYTSMSAQNIAQVKFDMQMKRKEREALERELSYEAESQRDFIIMVSNSVVLFLVSVLAITAVLNAHRRKKLNQMLDRKNAALEQQKEEMQVQNENLEYQKQLVSYANTQITDSINSALMIQKAALPSPEFMTELFGEHFVFFRPKDIVSGDFFWASKVGSLRLLAVADCTGHGVPGAFVSMLGISILNYITSKVSNGNVSAGRMLDDLRGNLKRALHQHDEGHHGMDLALVILDTDRNVLHYAGALRPLYLFHNGLLNKVEPDRMPIGAHPLDDNNFTNHEIPVAHGDMVYLMSDGIVDQFGFDNQKQKEVKFSAKQLAAVLGRVCSLPCQAQCEQIGKAVDAWRRLGTPLETEQTDDNLLIGFRV